MTTTTRNNGSTEGVHTVDTLASGEASFHARLDRATADMAELRAMVTELLDELRWLNGMGVDSTDTLAGGVPVDTPSTGHQPTDGLS